MNVTNINVANNVMLLKWYKFYDKKKLETEKTRLTETRNGKKTSAKNRKDKVINNILIFLWFDQTL